MPKQIVIDKSAFQGTSTECLRAFVEDHWLVLPEILVYECATAKDDPESKMLYRFLDVMLAGAYTCPDCMDMMRWEARNLQPYPSLTDLDETVRIRQKFSRARRIWPSSCVQQIYDAALESARVFCQFTKDVAASMRASIPDAVRAACKELRGREDQLRLWAGAVDEGMRCSPKTMPDEMREYPITGM